MAVHQVGVDSHKRHRRRPERERHARGDVHHPGEQGVHRTRYFFVYDLRQHRIRWHVRQNIRDSLDDALAHDVRAAIVDAHGDVPAQDDPYIPQLGDHLRERAREKYAAYFRTTQIFLKEPDADHLRPEGEKKGGDAVKHVAKVRAIGHALGAFGVPVRLCLPHVHAENAIDGDINE